MIDVFDGERELVVMVLGVAARVLSRLVNRWPVRKIDEPMPWAYGAHPGRARFRSSVDP